MQSKNLLQSNVFQGSFSKPFSSKISESSSSIISPVTRTTGRNQNRTYSSSVVVKTDGPVEACFYKLHSCFEEKNSPSTYREFINSMNPAELKALVEYISSAGRRLLASTDQPMVSKLENILHAGPDVPSAMRILENAISPCTLSGEEALAMFITDAVIMPDLWGFDGSFFAASTMMKYLLQYSSGLPAQIYPLQFINIQFLLNALDSLEYFSTRRAVEGVHVNSMEELGHNIDMTAQLLQSEYYSHQAGIEPSQYSTINSGMESYINYTQGIDGASINVVPAD